MKVIVLPSRCDVTSVGALHAEFVSMVDAGAVCLDGRQVERADLAGVQLLLTVSTALAQTTLVPSDELRRVVSETGLFTHLKTEAAMPGEGA
jgi:anti-anti-sigma regulatory factor